MTAPASTTGLASDSNSSTDNETRSSPGIYLVNSGIRPSARDIFPPELFNTWYNEVHIPDIFATSPRIINTAYRFSAVDNTPPRSPSAPAKSEDKDSTLPYLAIYPVQSTSLLTTPSSPLWSVPLTSEILPDESQHIFELVDFQMGIWEKVIQLGATSSLGIGPAGKFLALVGISQDEVCAAQAAGTELEGILEGSVLIEDESVQGGKRLPEPGAKRSTLVRWVEYHPPGAPVPDKSEDKKEGVELSWYRGYLAIHEYDELPAGKLVGNNGAPVYLFSALKSLGDGSKAW